MSLRGVAGLVVVTSLASRSAAAEEGLTPRPASCPEPSSSSQPAPTRQNAVTEDGPRPDQVADYARQLALGQRPRVEMLFRVGYALTEPASSVRFSPAPNTSTFATEPGGIYEGSEAPFRGAVTTNAGVGYRPAQRFSVGLGGSFIQFFSAVTAGEGSSGLLRRVIGIAPYVRLYQEVSPSIEAWLSLSAGYAQDTITFDRMTAAGGTTAQGKWTLTHQGLAFPITIGVDWRPTSWLYLGPSAQYLGVIALRGCLAISAPNLDHRWCSSDDPSVTRAFSHQNVSLGLSVRAAVF